MTASHPPLITRSFVLLVLGQLFQALGYATLPLLPLYLDATGATRTEIGFVMASAGVGGLAMRPLVGWALDSFGRKPTLLAGTVLLALGVAGVGLVEGVGPLVFVDRVIFGIGVGALFTGYFTFAGDIIPPSRRTEGIALFGIAGLLPLTVNPVAHALGVEGSELRFVFPIVGALILASSAFLLAVEEPPRPPRATPLGLVEMLEPLKLRTLSPVWLATMLFSGLVATFFAYATVTAEERGIDHAANLWLMYAAGAITIRIFGARLPDRIGPSNLVVPALAFYVVAVLTVAGGTRLDHFMLAGLFAGVGHGYCFPVLTAQVIDRSPEPVRGTALSVFTGLWDVSSLALTPVFGWLADTWSDGTMFSAAAVMTVVGMVAWAAMEHASEVRQES